MQLGWVDYWFSKLVTAIGGLGSDPKKGPDTYSDFFAWLMSNAKEADEVLRVKLEPIHLGLNARPGLLVCTCGGCTCSVILLPKMKDDVLHLKAHSHLLPLSREADLKGLLEKLHLKYPSKVIF